MTAKTWRLVPALDSPDLDRAADLVGALGQHPFVHGFKLGFALGLGWGLPRAVERLRALTDKPLIYDHQKAATDIPDTGGLFAQVMAQAGLDEVILFPQAGPRTLEAWALALKERDLKTIVGGVMTHPAYLACEGGFLGDDAPGRMYAAAVSSVLLKASILAGCSAFHARLSAF